MRTIDIADRKLGKRAPITDPRTFKLSKYLKADAVPPLPPKKRDYLAAVPSWPMYLNDRLGTCAIACPGHIIEEWTTAATGQTVKVTDADILKAYEDVSDYNPNFPITDRGCFLLDVMNYWRTTGIGGHKILSFASVDWRNRVEMRQAVAWFGNVVLGLALPISAQRPDMANDKPRWDAPSSLFHNDSPGSWGGHCVPIGEYSARPKGFPGLEVVTWGQVYEMQWGFLEDYADEAYVAFSEEWLNALGKSPDGFDLEQLIQDLNAL